MTNIAPIATVPGTQTVNLNGQLVFSAANGNAITFSDIYAGSDSDTVTLTAQHGSWTVGSTAGAQVSFNNSSLVILTGTLAQLNAALEGATYTPNVNYHDAELLRVEIDDYRLNPYADFESIAITITGGNQTPVPTDDVLTTVAEDAGPRNISLASLLSNDSAGLGDSGQTLTVTSVGNAVGGTVAISGSDVIFTPTRNYNGTASFDYTVTDDGTTGGVPDPKSATGHASFAITAVNDAPTFSVGNGKSVVNFGSASASGRGVAIQSDGKIVATGFVAQGGNTGSGLVRLNADGSLDQSFGVGGVVLSAAPFGVGSGVVLQADGKIVVAGGTTVNPSHFALARYNSDGSLDTSFGTGGTVNTAFGTSGSYGVTMQSDGKLVLFGRAGNDFALARYNTDGSLDGSFGSGGEVTTNLGNAGTIYSATTTADGKIVVTGIVQNGTDSEFELARYNNNGSLDATFGSNGTVRTDFASTSDIPYSVQVQSDGKIVVSGMGNSSGFSTFEVVRYNANGTLDTAFGTGGSVTTDFGIGTISAGQSVAIQADGKIVVAGYDQFASGISGLTSDFALVRYNSDGSLDTSFGNGGKLTTDIMGTPDIVYSVTVLADGRIVVVGHAAPDLAVARYNADGTLDQTFHAGGTLTAVSALTEGGSAVVLDSRVLVTDADLHAAGSYAGTSLTLTRHGGADVHDIFGASGNLSALTEGGNIVLSGVTIGTVTHDSDGMLLLTFGANATEPRVREAMSSITYADAAHNAAASVQIDWTFSDGNGGAQGSGGTLAASGSTTVAIKSSGGLFTDGTDTVTLPGAGTYFALGGNDGITLSATGETIYGGPGNDVYHVEAAGNTIVELANDGIDTVQTASLASYMLGANVENLTHTGNHDFTGIGNALNNVLIGGTGNDYLIGFDGNDTLIDGSGLNTLQGGKGDDIYAVQSNADTVFEFANEGTDQVQTFLSSYHLSANVENLTFVGSADHTGVGNELNNVLIGGTGNDYLIGLDGNDTLIDGNGLNTLQGGTGDDIYAVQSNNDTVFEFANEGTDEVQTFLASYTLSPNVEKLTFVGAVAHSGTGNALANTFTGSSASDSFTGAGGNDVFNYRSSGNGLDTITDFNADNANAAEHDHIDLQGRGLNFAALAVTSGNGGVVIGIPGGDAIFLKNVTASSIDAGDFFF